MRVMGASPVKMLTLMRITDCSHQGSGQPFFQHDFLRRGGNLAAPSSVRQNETGKAAQVNATLGHRSISAVAALLVVAGGSIALLLGLAFDMAPAPPGPALEAVLPSRSEPAPPPPRPTPTPVPQPKRGGASAPLPAEAAPPIPPRILLPPLVEAPTARTPATGTAAVGAARGDGTGGAGHGGDGTGGSGSGSGGGKGDGTGDFSAYPRQTSGKLHYWEIPKALRRSRAGEIRLRYRIGTDGRVSECTVLVSSGLPAFDADTCARITTRFRFRPALDAQGRRVPFIMTETHGWDYEPGDE